jgi:hypothetical protein
MKRKFILPLAIALLLFSCNKHDHFPVENKYSADVANDWMQLQIKLTRSTTGYNSVVSDRSFAYAGITLYESISAGVPDGISLLPQIGGTAVVPTKSREDYYWPASLNAAMASITKQFFVTTTAANMVTIDSLENAYKARFKSEADGYRITNAEAYGLLVASSIFQWSKTDGSDEAYKHIVDPTFVPQVGEGLWVATFPAYGPPVHPHWGDNRSFIANSAELTQPGPPTLYSESAKSPFYRMVNELYTISLSLTHEDSTEAKIWGDQPGNLNVPAHATNILTQLIVINKMDLYTAAEAYALHGIAMNDASISTFKTKYKYNLLRPITYIRKVMLKSDWNSVLPTPPHPEYSAAHAVVSAASAAVLENIFGRNYHFTDYSYESSYGTRSFNSFQDYANEAGHSRLLAGIHYGPSIATGLIQGRKIGEMVNRLKVKN